MTNFFDTLAGEHIRGLPIYRPGKPAEELERELGIQGAIKASSNENPMGPAPSAIAAAQRAIEGAHWYPDGGAYKLREALAERLAVSPDELIFGAGSNEIIHMIVTALCQPGHDQVLAPRYAFISYRLAAISHNVEFVEADVRDDLACDADALIAAITPRTKVVFLANPNNPTGAYVGTDDFERILAALPERALLVADEAYHEYAVAARAQAAAQGAAAAESGAQAGAQAIYGHDYPLSQDYRSGDMPRILTLRTFSKIYGLSGLRVG
ncbi:MAG: aminotransferase class I/II-fold pyridoxal phosphate-dependent enzyme, partial [Myxococcota bacterium]